MDESGAALLQLRHMKLRHPLVVPLTRAFLDLNNNKGRRRTGTPCYKGSLYVDDYLCNLEQYIKRCSGMKCVTCHPDCHASKRVEEIRHCCLVGHGDWRSALDLAIWAGDPMLARALAAAGVPLTEPLGSLFHYERGWGKPMSDLGARRLEAALRVQAGMPEWEWDHERELPRVTSD